MNRGAFLFALTLSRGEVSFADGVVQLPRGGGVRLGYGRLAALGVECDCECLMWDGEEQRITAMGLLRFRHGADEMTFGGPVDVTYNVSTGAGTAYTQLESAPCEASGFRLAPWSPIGDENWRTHNAYSAAFSRSPGTPQGKRVKA